MKQVSFFALCLFMASCNLQKEPAYQMPPGLSDVDQKEFIAQFKKGHALYTINCGKCHNTTVKGKLTEPQFTVGQLENYELRVQNPSHTNHLTPKKVSSEDLRDIIYYLRNKKKAVK